MIFLRPFILQSNNRNQHPQSLHSHDVCRIYESNWKKCLGTAKRSRIDSKDDGKHKKQKLRNLRHPKRWWGISTTRSNDSSRKNLLSAKERHFSWRWEISRNYNHNIEPPQHFYILIKYFFITFCYIFYIWCNYTICCANKRANNNGLLWVFRAFNLGIKAVEVAVMLGGRKWKWAELQNKQIWNILNGFLNNLIFHVLDILDLMKSMKNLFVSNARINFNWIIIILWFCSFSPSSTISAAMSCYSSSASNRINLV